jgi:hypothetical protein
MNAKQTVTVLFENTLPKQKRYLCQGEKKSHFPFFQLLVSEVNYNLKMPWIQVNIVWSHVRDIPFTQFNGRKEEQHSLFYNLYYNIMVII